MSEIKQSKSADLIQLVSFKLGQEEFGIDILKVQEINLMVDITKVPEVPDYCEGIINLRGKIFPVIDLRKKFGLDASERTKNTRIIVCDIDGNILGMIVDSVEEVLRIPEDTIEPTPTIVTSVGSDYINGICRIDDRLLMFLDISKLSTEVGSYNLETVS